MFLSEHRTRQPLTLGLAAFALWECLGIMVLTLTFVSQMTARRQAEAEARALHQHVDEMRYVLEQAMLVSLTDRDGTILFVNDSFCQVSGYAREELIGANHRICNSGHHPRELFEDLWTTILGGQTFRSKPINRKRDGTEYHAEQTITPIRDRTGRLTHFVSVVKDVTERIRNHAREVEIRNAARVQQRLYPPQPLTDDRLDLAAICLPATATGGDYFDFWPCRTAGWA